MEGISKSEVTYPYRWSEWFTLRARVRRANLAISTKNLTPPQPYFRWLKATAWVASFGLITHYLFGWIFSEIGSTALGMWWAFLFVLIISVSYFATVHVYSWVQRWLPHTTKVQILDSPEFPASPFTPGEVTDTVEVPESDKPHAPKLKFAVELIYCGGVVNVPPRVTRPAGPVVIARCAFRNLKGEPQAGIKIGKRYLIPAKPEPMIAGDVTSFRTVDWAGLAKKHFPGRVHDFTRIIVAMDLANPATWEAPSTPNFVHLELFEARARINQLETELARYTRTDRFRRRIRSRSRDESADEE